MARTEGLTNVFSKSVGKAARPDSPSGTASMRAKTIGRRTTIRHGHENSPLTRAVGNTRFVSGYARLSEFRCDVARTQTGCPAARGWAASLFQVVEDREAAA